MARGYSTKKIDLTGERFGKLTVLAPAENIGSRTAWLCRCDCGRELVAKTVHLRAGKVRSCGCLGSGVEQLHYVDGTCVEMLRKNTVRSNNRSGVPGVDWRERDHRWRASICFKGKRYYLGSFENFDDAVAARKNAEADMHGAFLAAIDGGQTAMTEPA